jgi:hypothetical protein
MTLFTTADFAYFGGDSARYLRLPVTTFTRLFGDPGAPAGYPAFLKVLHWVTHALAFTIGVQHLIGIATGLLLYAAMRRVGGPRWLGLVPAAAVLLNGDNLFVEHALIAETLWTGLLAFAMYAAMRSLDAPGSRAWLAGAGALLGLSAIVRGASLLLPVLLAIWALFAFAGTRRQKALMGATALGAAAVVVGGYAIVASSVGPYVGLGEMSGWQLYQRVTPFAKCSAFKPPAGTSYLCDPRPPSQRLGGAFYLFNAGSPAAQQPIGPDQAGHAGAFARAAIIHEPFAYAKVVVRDLVRFADPEAGTPREGSGSVPAEMSFRHWRTPAYQADSPAQFANRVSGLYSGVDSTPTGGTKLLATWQSIFRGDGLLVVAFLVLAVLGLFRARGRVLLGLTLFGSCALLLYALPPITIGYDARYGLPPFGLLVAAGTLGTWALMQSWRRGEPAAA